MIRVEKMNYAIFKCSICETGRVYGNVSPNNHTPYLLCEKCKKTTQQVFIEISGEWVGGKPPRLTGVAERKDLSMTPAMTGG